MEISPERLNAFRAIYREKFGVELTPQEALEKALPLLALMNVVYQPITEDDLRNVQERRLTLLKS